MVYGSHKNDHTVSSALTKKKKGKSIWEKVQNKF